MSVGMRMRAGDESIQAIQLMDETQFHQFVECPIHLLGGPQTLLAQLVQ